MGGCPDECEWQSLLKSDLAPEQQQFITSHLDRCALCRRCLDKLVGADGLLPGTGDGAPPRLSVSPALRRVMDEATAAPAGQLARRWPFLSASDRPGLLGTLGPYDIRRVIGRGGMGVVFEGFDPMLNRTVAVKVLSPLTEAGDEDRARFLREARAAAALTHENIVAIYAVDEADGWPFLVLQFVPGESLAGRLSREVRLPLPDVVRLGVQVARGLVAAHEQGFIHRDIKPANILLEAGRDRAKIADFGLAKSPGEAGLTVEGVVAGTPEYMSPEQAAGGALDARSDLFSLGVVLYQTSTGISPFRAGQPLATMRRVETDTPAPAGELAPDLPAWFSATVARLLEKDPANRFASAAELADALERGESGPTLLTVAADRPTQRIASKPAATPARPQPRWPWLVLPAVAAAVVGFFLVNRRGGNSLPPAVDRPPDNRVVVIGRSGWYRSLTEAVHVAADGDTVELHGDGPFLTRPLRSDGRRLVVRAATGSRPLILPELPDRRNPLPFITADADLGLEGLDIRWTMDGPSGRSDAELLSRCAVAVTRGRLAITHCRLVGGAYGGCLGASGDVAAERTHLTGVVGVFWRPASGGHLSASGCQFEGRTAVSVQTAAEIASAKPAALTWEFNTAVAERALHLMTEAGPKQRLDVTARRSVFDCSHLVVMIGLRNNPRVENAAPGQVLSVLQSRMSWADDGNIYRRGLHYVLWAQPQRQQPIQSAGVDDLKKWLQLWKLPPGLSVEGRIRFLERRASARHEPLVPAGVDQSTGEVPSPVGAPVDRLGPGAPYDTWRAGSGR